MAEETPCPKTIYTIFPLCSGLVMEINKLPFRFKFAMFLLIIAFAFPLGILLGPLIGSVLGKALETVFGFGGNQIRNGLGMGLANLPGMLVGMYIAGLLSKKRHSSLKPYLNKS